MARIWVDVEDLFAYIVHNPRPSGVQRGAFEICRGLREVGPPEHEVRFVRHGGPARLREVPFAVVEALFAQMTDASDVPRAAPPPARLRAGSPLRGRLRRQLERLPQSVRIALYQFLLAQLAVVPALKLAVCGSLAVLLRRTVGSDRLARLRRGRKGAEAKDADQADDGFAAAVRAGDVLFVPGAGWSVPGHADLIESVVRTQRLRVVLFCHDLIPVRAPQWCPPELTRSFTDWVTRMLELAGAVACWSGHTREDILHLRAEKGLAQRPVVRAPPGFTPPPLGSGTPSAGLPAPGSYVLFVSTIEPRKNHALLFRVWRRLLADLPRDSVPTLVFAGRVTALAQDLMQQIGNSRHLDGHVRVIENPDDAELQALYRGCLFTIFPSLFEGWGLLGTGRYVFGKPCVVPLATSLPEAGAGLAREFDPDDGNDAYRVIRASIEDRAGLAAWEARVRAEFHPPSWSTTADAVLVAVAALDGRPTS
jgi:glycosyltransferase involved in cell wall biosynthesis